MSLFHKTDLLLINVNVKESFKGCLQEFDFFLITALFSVDVSMSSLCLIIDY